MSGNPTQQILNQTILSYKKSVQHLEAKYLHRINELLQQKRMILNKMKQLFYERMNYIILIQAIDGMVGSNNNDQAFPFNHDQNEILQHQIPQNVSIETKKEQNEKEEHFDDTSMEIMDILDEQKNERAFNLDLIWQSNITQNSRNEQKKNDLPPIQTMENHKEYSPENATKQKTKRLKQKKKEKK